MILIIEFIVFPLILLSHALEFKYHTNKELETVLRKFENGSYGNVRTHMYSIGKTKNRNNLWVLELTAAERGKLGVPNMKLIGNMHGNEAAGREVLLQFIEYLLLNYNTSDTIRRLLNNTKIHIMPTLNPDGFERSYDICMGETGRHNGIDLIDLNRDFPDYFHKNDVRNASESLAVRKWMSNIPFILSAALHGGALLANYPFDSLKETLSTDEEISSPTPDDDVFKHLATVYAKHHQTMHLGKPCNGGESFEGGITNGARWYSMEGSMGDYNYAKHGCMEVTLEISCCKYPKARELPKIWEENKLALLHYCMEANRAVRGQILDRITRKPIGGANLKILGREMTFQSFKETGEFWRILLPGKYNLQVEAEGYYTLIHPFEVQYYNDSFPQLELLEILLLNATFSTTTVRTTTRKTFSTPTVSEKITTSGFNLSNGSRFEDNRLSYDNLLNNGSMVYPEQFSRQIGRNNGVSIATNVLLIPVIVMLHFLNVY